MTKFLIFLGHVWASPITFLALVYMGFFSLMKWYVFAGVYGNALVWTFNPDNSKVPMWLIKLWDHWGGQTFGSVVILSRPVESIHGAQTLKHEQEHVLQYMKLGILFPLLYGLFCLVIAIALPSLHYYRDNLFERDAQEAAKLTK